MKVYASMEKARRRTSVSLLCASRLLNIVSNRRISSALRKRRERLGFFINAAPNGQIKIGELVIV